MRLADPIPPAQLPAEDRRSAPSSHPTGGLSSELLNPAGACDVHGVMLHLGLPASWSLPLRMFPREYPRQNLTAPSIPVWPVAERVRRYHGFEYSRRSHKCPPACAAPAAAACEARYHSHPPPALPRTASREAEPAPPVPLRFTASRLAALPKSSAPRPAASCCVLHPMPPAPQDSRNGTSGKRFGGVFRVVHVGGLGSHLQGKEQFI